MTMYTCRERDYNMEYTILNGFSFVRQRAALSQTRSLDAIVSATVHTTDGSKYVCSYIAGGIHPVYIRFVNKLITTLSE